MRIANLTFLGLTAAFVSLTAFNTHHPDVNKKASPAFTYLTRINTAEFISHVLYENMQLAKIGLAKEAMKHAYKGYVNLVEKGMVENDGILTICDFSQPSSNKRMYILDIKNQEVLIRTFVAHGKNTGLRTADKFSNKPNSHQSSLGFYITKGTYQGRHGLSLRLAGLEKGFNHNAEKRAIVVHGAGYIGDAWSGSAIQGRSFGCPAVPKAIAPKVINLIKDGTILFVYHPTKSYLHGSRLLNG